MNDNDKEFVFVVKQDLSCKCQADPIPGFPEIVSMLSLKSYMILPMSWPRGVGSFAILGRN